MEVAMDSKWWGRYIGHKVYVDVAKRFVGFEKLKPQIFVLEGVNDNFVFASCDQEGLYGNFEIDPSFCKLVLRTLDQMTDDEKQEFGDKFLLIEECDKDCDFEIMVSDGDIMWYPVCVDINNMGHERVFNQIKSFDWLTSKGFAIRGEIEQGLAVKEEL